MRNAPMPTTSAAAPDDLWYRDMPSPVGKIRLVASREALRAILWEGEEYQRLRLPEPKDGRDIAVLAEAAQQLQEYFAHKRTSFSIPIRLHGTAFQLKVWEALATIPFGVVRTYLDLAKAIGDVKAVRAVGGALNKNPIAIIVPCHRVIGASGKLVGFAGGLKNKAQLIQLEASRVRPTLF